MFLSEQFGFHLIEVVRRDPPVVPAGPRPPEVEFKPSGNARESKKKDE